MQRQLQGVAEQNAAGYDNKKHYSSPNLTFFCVIVAAIRQQLAEREALERERNDYIIQLEQVRVGRESKNESERN